MFSPGCRDTMKPETDEPAELTRVEAKCMMKGH